MFHILWSHTCYGWHVEIDVTALRIERSILRSMMAPPRFSRNAADIIRILISTDNHLGYMERDPDRCDDSFRTFEEVLALAKSNRADMILLGGDLFHDNKPSRRTVVRTMKLLREYCLGDAPVSLTVRSAPGDAAPGAVIPAANWLSPYMAIDMPILTVHGNHDDPTGGTGADALSALDVLAQANLITYFGHVHNSRKINVVPILLQKGVTKLALYGFGNVRDDVLHETWANTKQVHWHCPADDTGKMPKRRPRACADDDNEDEDVDVDENVDDDEVDADGDEDQVDWFNLFVIHQNRATRGTAKAVADTMLPQWLDYVLWGHEHDSIPALSQTKPPIVQPGSTVATSLSEGESLPKHCVLLEIYKGKLKHRPIPLQTVRNFNFDEVSLGDPKNNISIADRKGIDSILNSKVEDMISSQEALFDNKRSLFESGEGLPTLAGVTYPPNSFYLSHLPRVLRQPLIRLRVEYSGGFETLNSQRFGQAFVGRVSCANDILHFFKKRAKATTRPFMRGSIGSKSGRTMPTDGGAVVDDESGTDENGQSGFGVEDDEDKPMEIPNLVEYFLYHKEAGGNGLRFLELDRLSSAVEEFVDKAEPRAISDFIAGYLKFQQDTTIEKQEKKGSVLTDQELTAGFQDHAKVAALRVFEEKMQAKVAAIASAKAANVAKTATAMNQKNGFGADDGETEKQVGDADDSDDDDEGLGVRGSMSVEKLTAARFAGVEAQLARIPKLAAVSKAGKEASRAGHGGDTNEADDDNDNDNDDDCDHMLDDDSPPPVKNTTARSKTSAAKRASTAKKISTRKPPAASASRGRAAAPRRRAASAAPSLPDGVILDSEDGGGDEVEEEVEEYVPQLTKRKTTSGGASTSTRPTSRARGLGGRARQPTPTISLDDDSD
jgi:double-strand break repair protein MRE11